MGQKAHNSTEGRRHLKGLLFCLSQRAVAAAWQSVFSVLAQEPLCPRRRAGAQAKTPAKWTCDLGMPQYVSGVFSPTNATHQPRCLRPSVESLRKFLFASRSLAPMEAAATCTGVDHSKAPAQPSNGQPPHLGRPLSPLGNTPPWSRPGQFESVTAEPRFQTGTPRLRGCTSQAVDASSHTWPCSPQIPPHSHRQPRLLRAALQPPAGPGPPKGRGPQG